MAALAVIIGATQLQFPMYQQQPPLLVGVKFGRPLAERARHAATYVALFFRLATVACRPSLTNPNPASRNSYSMAPNFSFGNIDGPLDQTTQGFLDLWA